MSIQYKFFMIPVKNNQDSGVHSQKVGQMILNSAAAACG
jgi:hypothetical protein